ncbi:hypothetical protein KPATCC21470_0198 [Kitasatospora purpeofusca]
MHVGRSRPSRCRSCQPSSTRDQEFLMLPNAQRKLATNRPHRDQMPIYCDIGTYESPELIDH